VTPTTVNPDLERRANADADRLLDVVVELHEDTAATQSMESLRESFEHAKQPVVDTIAKAGGEVTGDAWLNRTLRAQVPGRALKELSDLDAVRALDVPHTLTAD
jgi:hypothetical protein